MRQSGHQHCARRGSPKSAGDLMPGQRPSPAPRLRGADDCLERSWLLLFALDPRPDVWRTIAKGDAVALALPEEPNRLAIDEDDVLQIEHHGLAARFSGQ